MLMLGEKNKSYTKLEMFLQFKITYPSLIICFVKIQLRRSLYPRKQLEDSLSTSSLFAHPRPTASYSAEGMVVTTGEASGALMVDF